MRIAMQELKPGGRLVVNAITLENVNEAYQGFLDLGLMPELSLVQVSRGAPLAGKYLRYEALNPVHIFWAEKPHTVPTPKETMPI
jgi:precorrin-6Y C5,15-methyltransferase (decarboxylating)